MNKKDLCPCPSCGSTNIAMSSKALKIPSHEQYEADVYCKECHRCAGAYGNTRKSAKDSARKMWNPNIKDVLKRLLKAVEAKDNAESAISYIVTNLITEETNNIIEKLISEYEYIDIQYNAKELQERYDELHSQYYGDNMNWVENAEWSYLITYLLETFDKDK